jgi:hypothetical protein
VDTSERLARIQQLLAGLPGPYGNEHLWTLIAYSDHEDPFADVHTFIADCRVIDSVSSGGRPPQAPQNAKQLAAVMDEVDRDAAVSVLVAMTSRTLAYRAAGHYTDDKAREVFDKLTDLLGHGTRWWTNTDLLPGSRPSFAWNPVTKHGIDILVVATGGGVCVAVLAVDED